MKIDGQLFGQAEVSLKNAVDILNGNKVSAIKLYPSDYEYVSDVENVCTIISEIVIGLVSLGEQMTSAKQSAMNLDSSFQVDYFKFMSSFGETSDFSIISNITNDDYNEHLLNYLEANLNSLSQEELQLYNELKFISESKEKLNNLYNQKENNNGLLHPIKEKEINDQIAEIEKNLGIYENKWYEDIGQAIVQTGAEWKQGFTSLANGEGVGEIWDATKKTVATGAVAYRSVKSGFSKLGEWLLVDSLSFVGGAIASGATWLFHDTWSDNDLAGKVMDATLDFVNTDLVGVANEDYYKNNIVGKWINENSTLKYDSAGAKAIQSASEFAGKIALATAATVVSGGTAAPALAPILLGTAYGVGSSVEKYTQSVDREHGESYNYLEAFGRAAAGGVAGAAEFYGYGQMGAGMLGVNISPQASTSFAKNFFTKDVLLDSASVVVDHGVSVAFGDETWQQALKSGGLEFAFALGMNAIGARQATKSARATILAKETYSHANDEITDKIIELNERNYSRNASKFTSGKDYYEAQAYVAKNNYWYEDSNGRWQHKVLDKNDPGLTACYTKKFKKEWNQAIDSCTVDGMTKTNNYNTNVNGFIDYVLGPPGKSYGTFGYKGNYNFAAPGSIHESLKDIRKIDGENFINTMAINRGTDVSNAKRIIFTEVDVPRSSVSMHTGKELGSNIQRLPGALPDNSLELVYESIDITDTVADSTKVIIKNENGKTLFNGSLSKLKEVQNDKKNRQFFNMIMGIVDE